MCVEHSSVRTDCTNFYWEQIGNKTNNSIMEILWKASNDNKGGNISFSLQVNATAGNCLTAKWHTLQNHLHYNKTLHQICLDCQIRGYSLCRRRGQYFSPEGRTYRETSFILELIGVTTEQLYHAATALCLKFHQRSVLVTDYNTNEMVRICP